jgi:flagellar secretion chaperone FliS
MYSNIGAQRYHETNINSITREKMIVLLYEKIISDLNQAAEAINKNDRVEMTRKVNHAQRIVSELRGALDHSIGGDIAQNLDSLYGFLFNEQLQLIIDQDVVHVFNCINVLNPLLEAWKEIPPGTADKAETEMAKTQNNQNVGIESADERVLAVEKARAQAKAKSEVAPPPSKPLLSVSA